MLLEKNKNKQLELLNEEMYKKSLMAMEESYCSDSDKSISCDFIEPVYHSNSRESKFSPVDKLRNISPGMDLVVRMNNICNVTKKGNPHPHLPFIVEKTNASLFETANVSLNETANISVNETAYANERADKNENKNSYFKLS